MHYSPANEKSQRIKTLKQNDCWERTPKLVLPVRTSALQTLKQWKRTNKMCEPNVKTDEQRKTRWKSFLKKKKTTKRTFVSGRSICFIRSPIDCADIELSDLKLQNIKSLRVSFYFFFISLSVVLFAGFIQCFVPLFLFT